MLSKKYGAAIFSSRISGAYLALTMAASKKFSCSFRIWNTTLFQPVRQASASRLYLNLLTITLTSFNRLDLLDLLTQYCSSTLRTRLLLLLRITSAIYVSLYDLSRLILSALIAFRIFYSSDRWMEFMI